MQWVIIGECETILVLVGNEFFNHTNNSVLLKDQSFIIVRRTAPPQTTPSSCDPIYEEMAIIFDMEI